MFTLFMAEKLAWCLVALSLKSQNNNEIEEEKNFRV